MCTYFFTNKLNNKHADKRVVYDFYAFSYCLEDGLDHLKTEYIRLSKHLTKRNLIERTKKNAVTFYGKKETETEVSLLNTTTLVSC